jgi:hypothetical protein
MPATHSSFPSDAFLLPMELRLPNFASMCFRVGKVGAGVISLGGLLACAEIAVAAPPFSGTIFIDREIVTPEDPTAFQTLEDAGRGLRTMFDRRVNNWVTENAFLFNAHFDDGLRIEVQVNPEFGSVEPARTEALRYLHAIGQLPTALRADVETVWLHKGFQPFGGGNNNLLIHSEQADAYISDGILEETLMHEASHTSLDPYHAKAAGWIAAQNADPEFISTYARDNPQREDIAETFVPYFAVQFRLSRIPAELAATILQTIPNRIAYLNGLGLDMHPIGSPLALKRWQHDAEKRTITITWSSRQGSRYAIESSTDLSNWAESETNIAGQVEETSYELAVSNLPAPRFFRVRQL